MDEEARAPRAHTPQRAKLAPPSRGKRVALVIIGWLAVALAIIGIPLPILPTTPFLILAAACFLRSSPKAHARLLAHPRFGPLLAQWQARRTIPTWAKRRALLLIAVTFATSIAIVDALALRIMLLAIGLSVATFVARLNVD